MPVACWVDSYDYLAVRADFATPDVDVVDLAVITIDASVLKRIEEAFLNVVEIASAPVGRMHVDFYNK